jgi:hypothetical protein
MRRTAKYGLGIGYVKPESMTTKEFQELYEKWNKKLKNSGFFDLERFSPDNSGFFAPQFNSTPDSRSPNSSAATAMRRYAPDKEEYYTLFRHFANNADFKLLHSKRHTQLQTIALMHSEGYSASEVAETVNGRFRTTYTAASICRIIRETLKPAMFAWTKENEGDDNGL